MAKYVTLHMSSVFNNTDALGQQFLTRGRTKKKRRTSVILASVTGHGEFALSFLSGECCLSPSTFKLFFCRPRSREKDQCDISPSRCMRACTLSECAMTEARVMMALLSARFFFHEHVPRGLGNKSWKMLGEECHDAWKYKLSLEETGWACSLSHKTWKGAEKGLYKRSHLSRCLARACVSLRFLSVGRGPLTDKGWERML